MSDERNDRDGDPFEEFEDAVGDREGNPFEELSEDDSEASAGDKPEQSDEPAVGSQDQKAGSSPKSGTEDVFEPERFGQQDASGDTGPGDSTEADSDGSGMKFGIGQRESPDPGSGPTLSETDNRDGDPYSGIENAFAEMDIEQLDPDSVWQELTSAQSRGSVGDARKRTYAEVSKHSYCEQCEHFSEPPDVHCSHDGTEIVEFLDMETVRVVDCPVVAERKELESAGDADDSHGKD